jgi:hypothetical protein
MYFKQLLLHSCVEVHSVVSSPPYFECLQVVKNNTLLKTQSENTETSHTSAEMCVATDIVFVLCPNAIAESAV